MKQPFDLYSSRYQGQGGFCCFFDVKQGEEGRRLVLTLSYPSGRRDRITVPQHACAGFVSELLKAVSAMAEEQEPPPQHPPEQKAAIQKRFPRAYEPWTPEEDARLLQERSEGHGTAHLGRSLQRPPSAVLSRLNQLGDPARSQLSAVRPTPESPQDD